MTIIPEKLMLKMPSEESLSLMDVDLKERVLFKKESDFHNIFVVENNIGRFIKFEDTYQAGFIETKEYKGNLPYINYFLIPYLMNQSIKNILLIGLGSGILVKQYKAIFPLEKIDIVDIEENIVPLAKEYFGFEIDNKNTDFYLQDALVYLKTSKEKYDLIIADVANNKGIDERFCDGDYLRLIKSHLKKDGIFVSNMPSSRDIFNKKNRFILKLLKLYKNNFSNVDIYSGETSNRIFYKTFFNTDKIILDITNLILISSDKKYKIETSPFVPEINIDLSSYINDLVI